MKDLELRMEDEYTVAEFRANPKNGFGLANVIKMYLECKDYDGELLYKLADEPNSTDAYDAKSMIDSLIFATYLCEGRKVIFLVEGTDEKAACLAQRVYSAAIFSNASDMDSDRLKY